MATVNEVRHPSSEFSGIPPQQPALPSVSTKALVVAGKVAVAALIAIAAAGTAIALAYLSLPTLALSGWAFLGGVTVLCGALGLGIGGGVIAPLKALFDPNEHLFSYTDHNLQDCQIHAINTIGHALIGSLTAALVPGAVVGLAYLWINAHPIPLFPRF